VRHCVAIILGLRHTRGKVIGHRTQLDPGRQIRRVLRRRTRLGDAAQAA
jgi:hypothetical protein